MEFQAPEREISAGADGTEYKLSSKESKQEVFLEDRLFPKKEKKKRKKEKRKRKKRKWIDCIC